jgi:hypothetical protein
MIVEACALAEAVGSDLLEAESVEDLADDLVGATLMPDFALVVVHFVIRSAYRRSL